MNGIHGDVVKMLQKAVAFESCIDAASYENFDDLVRCRLLDHHLHLATATLEAITPKGKLLVVNVIKENPPCTESYLREAARRKDVRFRVALQADASVDHEALVLLPETKERLHLHKARKEKAQSCPI